MDIIDWKENRRRLMSNRILTSLSVTEIPWTVPQFGYYKVNFDASFYKLNKSMGAGLIIIDDAGGFQGAGSIPSVAEDEEQADALAAYEATKMARTKAITNLQLEGDCVGAVNDLNGKQGSIRWTTNSIIRLS
ncbi:uncharacterized protein LOC113360295 [Papaver somniferum]|uniref:uncharacterized protein LOC113360295 n=1 Tax=Papaver somniferum TaxID=3469 RepID=UPI000E7035B7|nr:uncharacterized protein LOC113360295 [Papaver somniferum]